MALIEGEGLPSTSSDKTSAAAPKSTLETQQKSESDWKKPPSLDLPPSPTPA
jgi:hypothetical protein